MSKRKPPRTPTLGDGSRALPPPVDFGARPPHICTVGNDLAESERYAAALARLREELRRDRSP